MRGLSLTLTEDDFNLLQECYLSAGLSEFNKNKLFQELKDAKIVKKESLPLNIVCANVKVLVFNMDKKQTFSIHIVESDTIGRKPNELPLTDPIAIALLGYPTGAVTEWEMPDGINRFKIISVNQEAASFK